ncbi:hypothetical protein [Speluncibacter jeojiensis]|uniref:Uncharacterized protein n=1 Tax=Speluncibacter jeojiensis TaxID=2710754 RepID=A0A9X4M3B8_9ACTN|nr:hypothetical protein [Rhodococcus sp. D2-41]MDG3016067.1 hypothetical protein [Corynebacteriales bacterium D3-21]
MIYLLAMVGLATLVVLAWRAFGPTGIGKGPVTGPDDDPEFLHSLGTPTDGPDAEK